MMAMESVAGAEVEQAVDTKTMAKIQNCSVPTMLRMAQAGIIPSHFVGAGLSERRFYPSKVIAALEKLSAGRVATNKRRTKNTVTV